MKTMRSKTLKVLTAAVLCAFAFGAAAQDRYYDDRYDDRQYDGPPPSAGGPGDENISFGYADVLRVDPIYDVVRTSQPREECYDERVVRRERGDNTGGTILGAVIGGALGNQVGKGDGRRAATIAGAVAGGAIGHNVDKRNDRSYATTETRCRVVDGGYQEQRRVSGYDVEYRYRGEVYVSRLNYNPGDKLRVRVAVAPAD